MFIYPLFYVNWLAGYTDFTQFHRYNFILNQLRDYAFCSICQSKEIFSSLANEKRRDSPNEKFMI